MRTATACAMSVVGRRRAAKVSVVKACAARKVKAAVWDVEIDRTLTPHPSPERSHISGEGNVIGESTWQLTPFL